MSDPDIYMTCNMHLPKLHPRSLYELLSTCVNTNSSPATAVLFGINRFVDACFLADMFIQAFLGYLDRKRNRWESRPSVTVKTYCKHWLVIDTLSLVPYDAIVILVPSHFKLKVSPGLLTNSSHNSLPFTSLMHRVCVYATQRPQ